MMTLTREIQDDNPICFGLMDEEKVVVYHIQGSEVKKYQVIKFKDEGLEDVRDFTFYDYQVEILTRNQVVIYTFNDVPQTSNSQTPYKVYLKAEDREGSGEEAQKERNDLQMFAIWRVGVPKSAPNAATINAGLLKARLIVNGIKELTYIEEWDDNSPQTILENLFRPVPVRCQSSEVVMKTPTDSSQFFTYYVLREKDKLHSGTGDKKDYFEKIYLKGDYSDCFVGENFVIFWGRSDLKIEMIPPRLVYFGSFGAVGFFLNELPLGFSEQ